MNPLDNAETTPMNQDMQAPAILPPANRWMRRIKKMKTNSAGIIGIIIMLGLIFMAAGADFLAPYSYKEQHLEDMNTPPCKAHLMGTDEFGRMS